MNEVTKNLITGRIEEIDSRLSTLQLSHEHHKQKLAEVVKEIGELTDEKDDLQDELS